MRIVSCSRREYCEMVEREGRCGGKLPWRDKQRMWGRSYDRDLIIRTIFRRDECKAKYRLSKGTIN